MGVAVAIDDSARRSQSAFRAIMTAMSHPGRIERVEGADAECPLPGCMGDVALTLCDFETPVWLDPELDSAPLAGWFRFNTGAPLVEDPSLAAFGFLSGVAVIPKLEDFAIGSDVYPDRSTTLVVAVERLSDEGGMRLLGPGVNGATRLNVGRTREGLFAERGALREIFPRGVDLIFVCGDLIAALPRTTIIEA